MKMLGKILSFILIMSLAVSLLAPACLAAGGESVPIGAPGVETQSDAPGNDPDAQENDPDVSENDPDAQENDPDASENDPDVQGNDSDMSENDSDATEGGDEPSDLLTGIIRPDNWDGKHTNHSWSFTWDGTSISGECIAYTCSATEKLSLRKDALYSTSKKVFRYCPEKGFDGSEFITKTSWESEYYFTYAPMDGEGGWTLGLPTEPGKYKLTIRMPESAKVEDKAGDYGDWKNFVCVEIMDDHFIGDTWTTDGVKLCGNCGACGTRLVEVSIDESSSLGNACSEFKHVPNFTTWFYNDAIEHEYNDSSNPGFGLFFEGKSAKMKQKYPLQTQIPGEVGVYNVYIGLFDGDFTAENITLKTDPVDYEVKPHLWEYSSDEYSLHADCSVCDAHAEVCIDTSTVYEASRTFSDEEILNYDVFYERDWSNQVGIANYSVLFTGKETGSNTLYDRAFSKPTTAGDYDVRLALLSDEEDPNSAYLSTKEKHFYLADFSAGECSTITYGNTEIAQFPEPSLKNGYYQVGTKEELLWCLYRQNTTANIELTNDIVVNPITVDDKGNVYCANTHIYLWDGFGDTGSPYTGSIKGNGYTIYGLYTPDASKQYSGLIDYGRNCNISDLTIENSVLYGVDAGALMARCDITGSNTTRTISNCRSLNCYISGSSTQGGLISWINSDKSTVLTIESCGNDSIVCGTASRGAGGIVGKAEGIDELVIRSCYNLGPITSYSGMAGGIIGYGNLDHAEARLLLWDNFNTGDIKGSTQEGGIAGYLKDYGGKNRLYIENCTSTGYLASCSSVGGLAGYIDSTCLNYANAVALPNFYYGASIAFKTANSNVNLESNARKLTKAEYKGGFVCSRYCHVASSHWDMVSGASCTGDGELMLKCAVCGAVMEDETIRAYGHHFTAWGECERCGISIDDYEEQLAAAEEDEMAGSVFGRSSKLVALVTGGTLVVLMAVWLTLNRKHRRNKGK